MLAALSQGSAARRVRPAASLVLPGAAGAYASTPDSAGVTVTGDIDVRADVVVSASGLQAIAGQWGGGGAQAWLLYYIGSSGILHLVISDRQDAAATASVALSSRLQVRAVWVSATGVTTFYTRAAGGAALSVNDGWAQLGSAVAGVAGAILNVSVSLAVGCSSDGGNPSTGRTREVVLMSGVAGTVRASPDFAAQAAGATSFSDAQGNVWTVNGTASIGV
jgi:hypothetical protein